MAFDPIDQYSNYYKQIAYGGWSPCIEGNNLYGLRPFPGSVVPNCVGFSVGRFNEIQRLNDCIYLGSVNAEDMITLALSQGLEVGDKAVPGGVICWSSADQGHCANIEEVRATDEVLTSESGWNYSTAPAIKGFIRNKIGSDWYYGPGYLYQGIIYPPGYKPTVERDYYIMFMQEGAIKL